MQNLTIKTNNKPRFTIDSYELTEKERNEFDYLNWEAIDKGDDSATFFRYKGQLYDIGEFMRTDNTNEAMKGWHGYSPDSFFSGVLIRYVSDDCEQIIIGQYSS